MAAIVELEKGWTQILDAIRKLEGVIESDAGGARENPFNPKEYATIYTLCYNMCTQRSPFNWSKELYERHSKTIKDYVSARVLPKLIAARDQQLLAELVRRWQNHEIMNKWMHNFFMYLNRYYVDHEGLPKLKDCGLELFKVEVFDKVKVNVVAALVAALNRERDGGAAGDRNLLRNVVRVFQRVQVGDDPLLVYREDLEKSLVKAAERYFQGKAAEWIAVDSVPDYLRKAEAALAAESERVHFYFDSASERPLMKAAEGELLAHHMSVLLEKEGCGARALLRDERREELALLYRLFARIDNGLRDFSRVVREHVQDKGLAIVRAFEAASSGPLRAAADGEPVDSVFVRELLDLHKRCTALVKTELQGETLFQKAVKEGFEIFINRDVNGKVSIAELISSYCDRVLRAGGEKLSDEAVEEALEAVVQLFGYIQNKDMFGEIYRNQLAKRLLNARSASDDAERSMVSKLKLKCGVQFTGKMEGMMMDLVLGGDVQRKFSVWLASRADALPIEVADAQPSERIEFGVQVLTTGFWPSFKATRDLVLPSAMERCQNSFQTFYSTETQHRKLNWVHSLGSGTVRANYSRSYDLQVTTLQAVALVLFNGYGSTEVPFEDIRAALGVDEDIVKRLLHSLSCGKYQPILKVPQGRAVSSTDKFAFNAEFTCPLRKVRIPMPSLDESHNASHIEEDRSVAIEAAIVRTMKTRKTLTYQLLVSEVMQQLNFFKPNAKVIKRRIEHLIEREYLERDPDKANCYRYVA